MKTKQLLFLIGISLFLAACSLGPKPPVVVPKEPPADHTAYVALAEAATSASQSLTKLGQIEQAANPPKSIAQPENPAAYGMDIPTTINWNGPIEPLVQQIANATNYQLKVLGTAPAIPIIITIDAQNKPMGDILRDAGYQCGKRAQVVVFPDSRTVELRYAN